MKEIKTPQEQSYKSKLLIFLKAKNKLIYDKTKIEYINKEDIKEVKSWEESECQFVAENLSLRSDASCCPWCILAGKVSTHLSARYPIQHQICIICKYRERHGECCMEDNDSDTYSQILLQLNPPSIVDTFYHQLDKLIKELKIGEI